MQKVHRPDGVPKEAFWVKNENEWQLGSKKSHGVIKRVEHPVGEWRYWRPDGTLCCVANFDEEGRQHGLVERFHNDGTLASSAMWKHGNRHGRFVFIRSNNPTDEHYPSNDETWRYEFESNANWQENNLRWFLEDGTECTSDGRDIETAYDLDTIIGDSQPEKFLEKYAANIAAAMDEDEREEPKIDPLRIADLWGVTVPEIDAFVNFSAEADSFSRATDSRLFEDNIWRSVIAHPWENDSEDLTALFMGAMKIGFFGDSDHVYANIFQTRQEEPQPNAVFLWSHETYYIDEVLSLSLDDFAFRLAVAGAHDRERLSKRAARAAWSKLAGRSNVGWAACSGLDLLTDADEPESADDECANQPEEEKLRGGIESDVDDTASSSHEGSDGKLKTHHYSVDKSEFEVDLDPKNAVRGKFWRAQWIIQLLSRDSDRDMGNVKECFRPRWNVVLNDKNYKSLLESGRERQYQSALYLLWRLFWFNDQERLKECCAVFRDHPARAVRDLVELLDDIEKGNTKIGGIGNILSVREEFLNLDLAPERSEKRVEEAELAATVDNVRAAAVAEEATSLARLGLTAVIDKAWTNVCDPLAMKEFEKAARTIPGYESQWRAYDWVLQGDFIRAEQHLTDEVLGLGIWLGQNESWMLQPFIWSSESTQISELLLPAIGTTPGALDSRLVSKCISQLDIVEEYNFKRRLAVELLGIMREKSAIPRLCGLIDEYFSMLGDKKDFDARLASIPWDDLLVTLCCTLQTLATPNDTNNAGIARGALRKLLAFCIKEHIGNCTAPALEALVAWGDKDVLPFIGKLLNEPNDPEQIAALRAVETLAADFNADSRRSFVALEFRNPADHENAVTLMYHRAANALLTADPSLGEAESLQDALAEARTLGNYGTEAWLKWRLIECETVGRFSELDIDTIARYVRSPNWRVRTAALSAYTARGIAPPTVRAIYWPVVWQALDSATAADAAPVGVAALLVNPESVDRTAAAAWLWANPSEEAAKIIAKVVDDELDQYHPLGGGESLASETEWLIRALAKHSWFPASSKTIERCINSDYPEIHGAIVQEINSLPSAFAPRLLKIAQEDDGWQRYNISQWALSRQDDHEVSSAMKSANVTVGKLKKWIG
jgi:hypothetical protein